MSTTLRAAWLLAGCGAGRYLVAALVLASALALPLGAPVAQTAAPLAAADPAGTEEPAAAPPAAAPLAAAPQAPPASPSYQPGFIDAVGRFMRESVGSLDTGIKGARSTIDNLGDKATGVAKDAAGAATNAAQDAAGTLTRLPATNMVNGREKCVPAANGAPDCRAAAEALCRAKGYPRGGKSIDIQSAQKCSAQVWLTGRSPGPGDCALETFVTRAVCN